MAAAITTDSSNAFIYVALEDVDGFPTFVRSGFGDLATSVFVYEPGDGSSGNVKQGPDTSMFFYGNFGTDITVIHHDTDTLVNTDISPPSLGANVVNALDVNPANPLEIWIAVSGTQDLMFTDDGGASWSTVNNALGINATQLTLLWPNSTIVCLSGSTGAQTRWLYSTDSGADFEDQASAGLHSSANISGFDLIITEE